MFLFSFRLNLCQSGEAGIFGICRIVPYNKPALRTYHIAILLYSVDRIT